MQLLIITSANVNRFSTHFHWQIHKETIYVTAMQSTDGSTHSRRSTSCPVPRTPARHQPAEQSPSNQPNNRFISDGDASLLQLQVKAK